jgi:hypothetical protein
VTLEILDSAGKLVRRYSSTDTPEPVDEKELNVPMYWVRMPKVLPGTAGMHRWVWDGRYAPPPALRRDYPISANFGDTPSEPLGTAVLPGTYTAKLTAAGKTMTQTFVIKMDPRVKTPAAALARQFELSSKVCDMMRQDMEALNEVKNFRTTHKDPSLDQKAAALEGTGGGGRRGGGNENLTRLNGELAGLLAVLNSADAAPTSQAVAAVADLSRALAAQITAWHELRDGAK